MMAGPNVADGGPRQEANAGGVKMTFTRVWRSHSSGSSSLVSPPQSHPDCKTRAGLQIMLREEEGLASAFTPQTSDWDR